MSTVETKAKTYESFSGYVPNAASGVDIILKQYKMTTITQLFDLLEAISTNRVTRVEAVNYLSKVEEREFWSGVQWGQQHPEQVIQLIL